MLGFYGTNSKSLEKVYLTLESYLTNREGGGGKESFILLGRLI